MLANVVRRQARVVLTAAARQSIPSLLARVSRPSSLALRPFSTTLCRSDDYAARAQAPAGNTPYSDNPPNRQLFLGNLAFEANESDIRDLISPFGEVESVRIIHNPDGSSRGFAYATFAEQASADQCIQSPLQIFGRQVRVDYSLPPPGRILFVGNLAPGGHEGHVRDVFEPFGAIQRVSVGQSPRGGIHSFAHVEFLKEEDAVRAHEQMAKTPPRILDHELRVTYASPRPPPSPKPFRRGRLAM
ncbi:hypothetical protein R3P38DRAFT_3263199 [Favolaschia claudopus]|uniref:RRM domain-containing protein n=1 Tax=Favolaschia claudopus TaxID=2862362 RepID=A0AAW0C9Q2_9AGAR